MAYRIYPTQKRLWVLLAALLLAAWGCTHERVDLKQARPQLPERFAGQQSQDNTITAPDRWWESFNDPALDKLVSQALTENLDMGQAWARMKQVQALAVQQGSAAWPQVNGTLNASRNRQVNPFTGDGLINNNFAASVAVSYELDLWGRIGALDEAALLDMQASRGDLETVAMTITAQVADLWYGIVEQRALLDLVQSQVEINEQLLELVELRFGQGLVGALDVYQQRQQVLASKSQIPLIESRIQLQAHQMALVLGKPAGSISLPEARLLPELPPVPSTGVPSELLRRRPDLRAAELRMISADRRVEAAIADRYPSIRLTGSTGYQATDLGDLIDQWIWSMASSLTLPLLDGERRAAEVERQQAILQERLLQYGKTTLTAIKEVEDALVSEQKQREFLTVSESQLTVSRDSLREAQARYLQGLSDFLPVLTALRSVQQSEQSVLSARRQLVSQRIQLYRALGGDWTGELRAPDTKNKEER